MFTKVLCSRHVMSLTAIRAAIDRHLRSPPLSNPFSIFADSQFKETNKTLKIFLKNLSKNGEISGTKHKGAVTREVVKKLREKRACSCQLTPSVEAYVDRLVLHHPCKIATPPNGVIVCSFN